MKQLKKIVDITNWFIEEYYRLERELRLPTNIELASIMGIKTPTTINNILAKAQNIQPDQWKKFKDHFGIESSTKGSEKNESVPMDPIAMQILDRLSRAFVEQAEGFRSQAKALADQAEGFRAQAEAFKAQGELMAFIRKEMALEAAQGQMKVNLSEIRRDVTTIVERQESAVTEIRDLFLQLGAQRKSPSEDARKKVGRNDGNG